MKLRLLAPVLMMSLMMSLTEVSSMRLSEELIRINKPLEATLDMLESDIRIDVLGDPLRRFNKWLKVNDYVDVPYHMAVFSTSERSTIRSALTDMTRGTCVRFREISTAQTLSVRPYLRVIPGVGCRSYIGMRSTLPFQYVFLSRTASQNCLRRGILQHVFMHALGFTHEHSRPDRDKYIQVRSDVDPKKLRFFNKYGSSNQVTPYDYNSIMHLDSNAFGRSVNSVTMRARNGRFIGGQWMSFLDREKIRRYYCACDDGNCTR